MINIPTGRLPYEIVTTLPKSGVEFTVYALQDGVGEFGEEYCFYNGEYHEVDTSDPLMGFLFVMFQNEINKVIADFEARIEALEGGSKDVLFESDNISLTESMATIGKTIDITSTIKVSDGTSCKITLTNMTIDGVPIDDVVDTISLYALADWNWQGGEVYSDVFGNSAYFSFGTKPMNSIAQQVTLGFTNEQEHFDERTLFIGHIKVEVV